MRGSMTICWMPVMASMKNQRSISGPKMRPTKLVPWCWMLKSRMRMATPMGMVWPVSAGVAMATPSRAESTETAGVRMESA